MRGVLFVASASVFDDPGEREFRIFGSLCKPAGEIVETCGHPGIELTQTVQAKRDEAFRKEFGERRGHRFEVGMSGDEMNISIHRIARCRKNSVAANGLDTWQTGGFDKLEPFLDAARSGTVAIMID